MRPAAHRAGERHLRPLADCLEDFWSGADDLPADAPDPDAPDPDAPDAAAPVPPRLGPSGIAVRGRDLVTLLRPAYDAFTRRADGPPD